MPKFASLGYFIVDEFHYLDSAGNATGKPSRSQIGGGGTYAAIGARIWLPPREVGVIVDRGSQFPRDLQAQLNVYGKDMWLFRDGPERLTVRAATTFRGQTRGFNYLTPRPKITPADLRGTKKENPKTLHFICTPELANEVVAEINADSSWKPTVVYEPIPFGCVPNQLPALRKVLRYITILSPNAEEAMSLLSMQGPPTKSSVEEACRRFLEMGVGSARPGFRGHVVIRSGALGSCVASRKEDMRWVPAYWTPKDSAKVVDVTGAGNAFLGGLCAGLLEKKDIYEAVFYGSVSASFVIEQYGLPTLQSGVVGGEKWNKDSPRRRLKELRARCPAR